MLPMVESTKLQLNPRQDVAIGVLPYFHIYGMYHIFCISCPPVDMSFRSRHAPVIPILLWHSRSHFAQI